MSSQRQFVLGLLFSIALAILGYYTLFLTDFRLFREPRGMTVLFPEAGGVRKGDAVLVAGIRAGKVKELSYDSTAPLERRVALALSLDQDLPLRVGHSITIETATLLGGHNVVIDPGPASGAPISKDEPLVGTVATDALSGLSALVSDNRDKIDTILANIEQASGEFEDLLGDLRSGEGLLARLLSDPDLADRGSETVERASATFDNLRRLTDDVLSGRGVIGKLFTDEDLVESVQRVASNLDTISADLREITSDVRGGRGTLGRLLRDDEVGEDFAQTVAELRQITTRINSGEGTIGRLVVDSSLADDLARVTRGLAEGQGTIGRLLVDETVYENLATASADLASVLASVREGRGTVGRLLVDDDLYRDLRRALSTVNRSLEEFREVAPITSFTNVLFGAF